MKYNPLIPVLLLAAATAIPARSLQQPATFNQQTLFPQNTGIGSTVASNLSSNEGPFNSNVKLNEINIHAMRHFLKNFPASSDEYWLKTNSGYIVKFKKEAILNEVYYKLNGSFQYSVRYYGEKNLQKDLGNLVHRRFSGYTIVTVIEISVWDQQLFRIKIADKESIKTVQFCDGKLEIIDDLKNLGT
jgi:hypothetical protein